MRIPNVNRLSLLFTAALVVATSACGPGFDDEAFTDEPGLQAARGDDPIATAPLDELAADQLETFVEFVESPVRRDVVRWKRRLNRAPEVDAGSTEPTPVVDAGTPEPTPEPTPEVDAGTPSPAPAPAPTPEPTPVADAGSPTPTPTPTPSSGLWVTGYYPGWVRTTMPPSAIDYTALTHIVDFSLRPRADGSLEDNHGILPNAAATVAAAHASGVKVLLCIGGARTSEGFKGATSSAQLTTFVNNIVSTVTRYGYDGVDLDWEPLTSVDRPAFVAMVNALQARLSTMTPRRQLTAAVDSWSATTLGMVASKFDQVNIMTYDMSGVSGDWGVSWFNSPLHNGGLNRPSGNALPSAERSFGTYRSGGVAAGKLGIGVAFYGNIYSGGSGTSTGGVTAPNQRWSTAPSMTTIDYRQIMSQYHSASRYHFDATTKGAYLSIDAAGSADDRFINYDDEQTIAAKMAWAKQNGAGGVIIWQLAGGYLPTAAPGQRDPLLQAVKQNR